MKSLSSRPPKFFRLLGAVVVVAFMIFLLAGIPTALAAPISGVVTNRTTNKPSAGDIVALIQLQQSMQVVAHATTDAAGHYTLAVSGNAPMHLVRVTHEGVNYFQAVPPGRQTVNVDVYNAAEKVAGVTTEADVQRIESDQSGLRVTENYFVKNASSPPRTQFSRRAYEIYLPKDAQIVSSAALGPGSMPVQSSPVPLGPPGSYAFIFPLRPGETRFQVGYHLPYSGSVQIQPRVAGPVDNFALILPKSMRFTGTPAAAFQPINEDVNVQTYLVKNVTPGMQLAFHISGSGQLPQETAQTQGGANGGPESGAQPANPETAARAAANNNTRPGIGLGVPLDTPDPLHKYKWWIISLAVVLLAIGAGISMKQTNPPASAAAVTAAAYSVPPANGMPVAATGVSPPGNPGNHRAILLEALKEELFALESDRLEGRMSPEEYDRQKGALEIVLKRALERATAVQPTTV